MRSAASLIGRACRNGSPAPRWDKASLSKRDVLHEEHANAAWANPKYQVGARVLFYGPVRDLDMCCRLTIHNGLLAAFANCCSIFSALLILLAGLCILHVHVGCLHTGLPEAARTHLPQPTPSRAQECLTILLGQHVRIKGRIEKERYAKVKFVLSYSFFPLLFE